MANKKIMITLSEKKAKELEKLAKEKGVTKSTLISIFIEENNKKGASNEK